jgi:YVTN family beta-propeller protein
MWRSSVDGCCHAYSHDREKAMQRLFTSATRVGLTVLMAVGAACIGNTEAVAASAQARCAIVALKPIKVGSQPAALAITPGGKKGFVANANSRFVSPFLTSINTTLKRVRFGAPGDGTEAVIVRPGGRLAYAAGVTMHLHGPLFQGRVLPIRTSNDRPLHPIKAGHIPIGMTITPDGKTIYVLDWTADGGPGSVIPIRTATNKVLQPIKVGRVDAEDSITITRDGRTFYVTNFDSDTVTPVSTDTNRALAHIKVGNGPNHLAITPDGSMAYVTTDDGVTPIRLDTNKALPTIKIKNRPLGVAVTPDGRTAYVAAAAHRYRVAGTVTPIRVATNTALKPITVGRAPYAVAVSPDGSTVFVTNYDSNTITPIKTATNKVLKSVKVGKQPYGLVFTPGGRTLYVVDYTSDDGPGFVTPVRTCVRR